MIDSVLSHCMKSHRIRSFSGPYFHEFGLNAEQKNSQYGHFSRNEYVSLYCLLSSCQSCPCTCKSHFQFEERENIVKTKSCYLVKYSDTFKDGIPQKLSLNKLVHLIPEYQKLRINLSLE